MTAAVAETASGDALEVGARSLGVPLTATQVQRLLGYLALLDKWNRAYNLTAIREPARMITHHLLDALAVLPHLPQQPRLRILDVGSGGGVPGIPLAIARPDASVVLVDSSQKKSTFLTQAAIELGLTHVRAVAARVEAFRPDAPFDIAIARAFADLATFARTAGAHLARDGRLYAMKGALPRDEIAALPPEIEVVATHELDVPGLGARRHLVVMQPRGAAA